MKFWKCYNHPDLGTKGHDFAAEKPVCPLCGLDGAGPDARGAVAPRAVIHFDPPHPVVKNRGVNVLACQPAVRVGERGTMATGDPREANCPACAATPAFKAATAALAASGMYDVPAAPAEAHEEAPAAA